jgi:hypothetical protein
LRLRRRLKSYLSLPQNSLLIRRAILLVKRHDYLRYGTTTLFAALDVLEGFVRLVMTAMPGAYGWWWPHTADATPVTSRHVANAVSQAARYSVAVRW